MHVVLHKQKVCIACRGQESGPEAWPDSWSVFEWVLRLDDYDI